MESLKVVIVGNQATGKSSLLMSHTSKAPAAGLEYIPTVFDTYSYVLKEKPKLPGRRSGDLRSLFDRSMHTLRSRMLKSFNNLQPSKLTSHRTDINLFKAIEDVGISVQVWDTAGSVNYDHLRPLSYKDADAVILVYSVLSPPSFMSIETRWLPEIRQHCHPNTPVLLVGCKVDARGDEKMLRFMEDRKSLMISREDAEDVADALKLLGPIECSSKTMEGIQYVFEAAAGAALLSRHLTLRQRRKRSGRDRSASRTRTSRPPSVTSSNRLNSISELKITSATNSVRQYQRTRSRGSSQAASPHPVIPRSISTPKSLFAKMSKEGQRHKNRRESKNGKTKKGIWSRLKSSLWNSVIFYKFKEKEGNECIVETHVSSSGNKCANQSKPVALNFHVKEVP